MTTVDQLELICPGDARKKADVYINDVGVSIKQSGGSFLYNRLQRANILEVYSFLKFSNINQKLRRIDLEVSRFHQGLLERRNRPWQTFFTEHDFKSLLEFLMMKYSANVGFTNHPASLILEAPAENISIDTISVFTFDEYFEIYKQKIKIAIRRQFVGQASRSEHTRALGLSRKRGNALWVFNDVVGEPSTGWSNEWSSEARKTVYFLMIEKVA